MFGIDWMLLAGLGGFVATIVIGAPLTRALAEPDELRTGQRRPPSPQRERSNVTAGFTPLDLGEDPMQWPSQRPWPPGIESPPWPSQTWDDEHFGSFWRNGKVESPSPSGAQAGPHPAETPVRPPRRASREPSPRPSARTSPMPRATKRADRKTPPRAAATPRPSNGKAPSPSPRTAERLEARLPAVQPPPRAELEQLIATIGLAGTVQNIMQRTGWDFRKAAHYLAKIRQQS